MREIPVSLKIFWAKTKANSIICVRGYTKRVLKKLIMLGFIVQAEFA
jgi:hypothetical protein